MYEDLQHTFGSGDGHKTACAMSLGYLLDCERRGVPPEKALAGFTDAAECVCPVIRRLVIGVNDARSFWSDNAEATAWMHSIAPRLLDTKSSPEIERQRAYLCADAAVRIFVPMVFDAATKSLSQAAEHAATLRALAPVVDVATAKAAEAYAYSAEAAAATCVDVAEAYAYSAEAAEAAAATCVDAAEAYAYSAEAAAANCVDAAEAAAYSAKAACADAAIKQEMLALLDRLIECGREDLTLQMLNACPPEDRHDHIEEADEWLRIARADVGMYDRSELVAGWVHGEALQ